MLRIILNEIKLIDINYSNLTHKSKSIYNFIALQKYKHGKTMV